MMDLLPWLLAAIGSLLGVIGVNLARFSAKEKDELRKQAEALKAAKEVNEYVQTLDDSRIIDEFDRLYNGKPR